MVKLDIVSIDKNSSSDIHKSIVVKYLKIIKRFINFFNILALAFKIMLVIVCRIYT